MIVYPPDGNAVALELDNGEHGMVIEFVDEDSAILFFEFMKQVKIQDENGADN